MPPANDLTGRTFQRLTVLGPAPKRVGNSNLRWRVQCSCKARAVKTVFGAKVDGIGLFQRGRMRVRTFTTADAARSAALKESR